MNSSGTSHSSLVVVTLVKPTWLIVIGDTSMNTINGSTPTVWPWPSFTSLHQGRDLDLHCNLELCSWPSFISLYPHCDLDLWPWPSFTGLVSYYKVVTLTHIATLNFVLDPVSLAFIHTVTWYRITRLWPWSRLWPWPLTLTQCHLSSWFPGDPKPVAIRAVSQTGVNDVGYVVAVFPTTIRSKMSLTGLSLWWYYRGAAKHKWLILETNSHTGI